MMRYPLWKCRPLFRQEMFSTHSAGTALQDLSVFMNSGDPHVTSAFTVICTDIIKHPNQSFVLANWLSFVFSMISVAHKMYVVNTITCSIYTWNFAVCYVSCSCQWYYLTVWKCFSVTFLSAHTVGFFVGFLPFPVLVKGYSTFHVLFKRNENGTDTLKGSK